MMSPRTVPATNRAVSTRTNAPNPLTVAMVGALDVFLGLGLTGRRGRIIGAMTGNQSISYRGDLGPLQSFKGWHPPISTLLPGAPMSLPMTGAPDPNTGPFKATR